MRLEKIMSVASWAIVALLVFAIVLLWIDPPTGLGPVGREFGVLGSQVAYTAIFLVEGVVLVWAKLTGRMRARKAALLAIFLTGVFTFGLTISIVGFSVRMLDNMVLYALAGFCYLYWQIKTAYVTREEYRRIRSTKSQ